MVNLVGLVVLMVVKWYTVLYNVVVHFRAMLALKQRHQR